MIKIKQNIKYLGTAATVVCRKHQTSHARHLLYIQDTSPKSRKLLGPCCVRSAASSFGTNHGAAFRHGRPGHPVPPSTARPLYLRQQTAELRRGHVPRVRSLLRSTGLCPCDFTIDPPVGTLNCCTMFFFC